VALNYFNTHTVLGKNKETDFKLGVYISYGVSLY